MCSRVRTRARDILELGLGVLGLELGLGIF